jgi:predicted O-linked N-acetylglucosamine transferase (SPINDLY family)
VSETIDDMLQRAADSQRAGESAEAERLCAEILRRDSAHAGALNLMGAIAGRRGDAAAAAGYFGRAVEGAPDNARYVFNLSEVQRLKGELTPALEGYSRAISLAPDLLDAYRHGALAAREMCRRAETLGNGAVATFARTRASYYMSALGLQCEAEGRIAEAEAAYREAVEIDGGNADALINYGGLLFTLGRLDEAAAALVQACEYAPEISDAHTGLAIVLARQLHEDEALQVYRRGLKLPDPSSEAYAQYVRLKQKVCDWRELDIELDQVTEIVRRGGKVLPFLLLGMSDQPDLHQRCARIWSEQFAVPPARRLGLAPRRSGGRMRIGFLSGDFRIHPMASLMPELFERFDRARCEIIGYSIGPDDGSALRRLEKSFDRFADLRALSDEDAARLIAADGVDILVDLMGYTDHARPRILAFRPAPVQAGYLCYAGTLGADFIDYLLADAMVVPPDQQAFYDEKLVYLPHCYLASDTRREIAHATPARAQCGLPETGFVFCCFNNSFKISRAMFDVWMRLLHAVRGSVLWLLESSPLQTVNLQREAASHGIEPSRLVFAPWLDGPEHLARQRLADLFLDTLPYNAHTTGNDALLAGLPVLTCLGRGFAGRVAASQLRALGIPELVTESLTNYEAAALLLAQAPEELAGLRQRVEAGRRTAPLFDMARLARDIETAFTEMLRLYDAGEAPRGFAVPPRAE